MAQGEGPRRAGAFSDASVERVEAQGHPMAVQFGVTRTDSPPCSLQARVQSTSRLAFYHGIDGPGQLRRQDGPGCARAVWFLPSGQQGLGGGILPQAEDGGFGPGPRERRMAHGGPGGAGACARRGIGTRDEATRGSAILPPPARPQGNAREHGWRRATRDGASCQGRVPSAPETRGWRHDAWRP